MYKNVGSTPVALDSLAVFLSVLTPAHPLEAHVIEIEIDHETVRSFCAPPHQARKRSESSSTLVPLRGLELAPGSSISATHLHLGTATININIALYIVSDARPGALLPTDVSVLPGRVDINADSYPDLVDVDQAGDVWTDLTRGDQNGAHDTQHSLIFDTALPAVMVETMRPEAWTLPGETSSSSSYLHFESELGCLNFEMREAGACELWPRLEVLQRIARAAPRTRVCSERLCQEERRGRSGRKQGPARRRVR